MSAELITIALNLGGIASLACGGIAWLRASARKEYASERDFEHLKRNYESLNQGIALVSEEIEALSHDAAQIQALCKDTDHNVDTLLRTFGEHRAFVLAISNRMEGIAAKLDSSTGGWQRCDRKFELD